MSEVPLYTLDGHASRIGDKVRGERGEHDHGLGCRRHVLLRSDTRVYEPQICLRYG